MDPPDSKELIEPTTPHHSLESVDQKGACDCGAPDTTTNYLAGPTRREWGKFHPQYTKVKVDSFILYG